MNRNKMYIAIGGLIAIILIGLLIYLMNSQSELGSKQTYTVEIYHCGPLAKDSVALKNEMSVFLLSSAIPASPGFIAPVVDLHEKLEKGDIKKISIPMSGLTALRETFVSDYYDFNNRKEEENDFIGEHGSFFSSEKYLSFSASALKSGDTAVNSVPYAKENCITEFFINSKQTNTNSVDNKVWNSLASLKQYINGLIAEGKVSSGTVIKVYYTCGPVGPPPSDMDSDGVVDNDDQCPKEKGSVECSGCPCPPPPACPGDGDSDRDGICDSEDKCPNEFGTRKYGGCKIPDTDGDGFNDEIDKCSNEASRCCGGCPDKDGDGVLDKDDDCDDVAGDASNRGCPKISIQFQKEIGQFIVTVNNVNKFKAYISAKQQNGTEITYEMDVFNDFTFGGPEIRPEFTSKFKSFYARLDPPDHLLVTVKVYDLNKKLLLTSTEYREMSIVCFEENLCGFKSVRD
jgi:hypothetical protein